MVPLFAQEISVPVNVQYVLFSKILTYDRNLESRVGSEIVFGIIYQSKFRLSKNIKNELVKVIEETNKMKIGDIPFRHILIDFDKNDLASAILNNKVDILYIAPLRAVSIDTIAAISRTEQIMTLTGVPEYCESGLAVGIEQKGGKPSIIVNLTAALAEGAKFSSQLLRLAKIIK